MQILESIDPAQIEELTRRNEFFWLDLYRPKNANITTLQHLLGLHPLAVEDSHHWKQRPKVELYPGHLLVVCLAVIERSTRVDGELKDVEVHLYIAENFLITIRRNSSTIFKNIRESIGERNGADRFLLYRILSEIADSYFPMITRAQSDIDALEERIMQKPEAKDIQEIHLYRKEVRELSLRIPHMSAQLRELDPEELRASSETYEDLITHEQLRDVLDHLTIANGRVDRLEGTLTGMAELFFNANTNKLNVLATRIAALGTFFLFWTIVTSFFGQNFGWMVRHINSLNAFLVYGVGGLLLPTIVLLIYFFKRRGDLR